MMILLQMLFSAQVMYERRLTKFECPEQKAHLLSTQQTALNCIKAKSSSVFIPCCGHQSEGARGLPRGDGGNIRQDAGGELEVKHGVGVHQYVAHPTVVVLIL